MNVPSALNMLSAPDEVAPVYAAYVGGAPEDIAVDAVGLGGVHVGGGAATTGLATGGAAVGAGRADIYEGVRCSCCTGKR